MKDKTSPWCPIDVAWWPAIAEALPHPWPDEAAKMDLRWWADQEAMGRVKRPGRPALAARWGWPDRQTRNAMRDAPERQVSSERPATVQPASSQRPETDTQTPNIIRPGVQPVSSQRPATVQPASPRAELHTTNNTLHTTEDKTITSDRPTLERPKPVRCVFDEIVRLRLEALPGARELTLTKARAQIIKARIAEHSADDVLEVVKWWLRSTHQRADYLRENGHGIDTLLRASNFPKYLEFSQEKPTINGGKPLSFSVPPAASPRRDDLPALSRYSERQVEAVKADLEGLQETCKPETWDRMVRTALAQSYGRAAK
jgi:hypothetical protein